uniref:Uncharacterized protein n=1 Tax=Arundo donax TaxID=35708 RepID=A0A0A9EEI8_ARUDO
MILTETVETKLSEQHMYRSTHPSSRKVCLWAIHA